MILWHRVNPLFFRLVGESGSSWCQKYTSANTFVEIMNFHKIFSLMISLFLLLTSRSLFCVRLSGRRPRWCCPAALQPDCFTTNSKTKRNYEIEKKKKMFWKKCWTDVSLWIRFLFLYSNEKSNNRWKEIETEDTIRRWRPLGYLFFCSYTIHWS